MGARRAGAGRSSSSSASGPLGGILNQCIHDGFGLFLYKETISGPEYAERLVEDVVREAIKVETGAMVLDLSPDRVLRINSRSGLRLVRAGAVVLAMGCRERTRDMIEIPGRGRPAICTAGLGPEPGQPPEPPRRQRGRHPGLGRHRPDHGPPPRPSKGVKVKGVFEILPWAGGLERNVRQCLHGSSASRSSFEPTVVDIRGRDRVESVVVAEVDERAGAGPRDRERQSPATRCSFRSGSSPRTSSRSRPGSSFRPFTGGAVVDETLHDLGPGHLLLRQRPPHPRRGRLGLASKASRPASTRPRSRAGRGLPAGTVRISRRAGRPVRPAAGHHGRGGRASSGASGSTRPLRNVRVEVKGRASGRIYARQEVRPPPAVGAPEDQGPIRRRRGPRGGLS
ncbi:MAG: hypothetical protein MZV64_43545 [Ignavibacteriales bacterium]|nr:hypothetical protein [Ignavibacteriales bacterium]